MHELSDLPIFKAFNEIKDAFHSSPSLVLKSPTGSGKSIGLPLLLLKENLVQGQILVVQPRRIAARLLARHVAGIMGSKIGDSIGYQVRFENKTSRDTKIIYLTDGEAYSPENCPKNALWVHSSRCSINEELPGQKIQIN